MKVSMLGCQKKLALLWFVYCAAIVLLLLAQTLGEKYLDPEYVWKWYFSNVMPVLSLIAGALMALMLKSDRDAIFIDRFFYRISWACSFFYLTLLSLSLMLENLTALGPDEMIRLSSLWLIPVQGLVAIFLGVFFNRGESRR